MSSCSSLQSQVSCTVEWKLLHTLVYWFSIQGERSVHMHVMFQNISAYSYWILSYRPKRRPRHQWLSSLLSLLADEHIPVERHTRLRVFRTRSLRSTSRRSGSAMMLKTNVLQGGLDWPDLFKKWFSELQLSLSRRQPQCLRNALEQPIASFKVHGILLLLNSACYWAKNSEERISCFLRQIRYLHYLHGDSAC